MTKYTISKPRKYTDAQGNEKTYWDRVGEMIEFPKQDGSVNRIIKIPAIGLEASVFLDKPKEAPASPLWPAETETPVWHTNPSPPPQTGGTSPVDNIPF